MCGILGYYLFDKNHNVSNDRFTSALRRMKHRGPDDEGVWKDESGRVCLGHRRLSIIDLSSEAHQPMVSKRFGTSVSYNGEIYNYTELNELLKEKGVNAVTSSDTETLLNAYGTFGEDCLGHFRGMFSFAVYNGKKDELFIARDRLGIKPFYYTVNEKGFYFSSEIGPLFEISGTEKVIRKESALEYFAFGKVHSPFTMFQGIMKLPSGHCGVVNKSGISLKKYWTPYSSKFDMTGLKSENDFSDRLFGLFRDSVKYRLVSDVPVGVFLSGGVDSTGILGMIDHLGRSGNVFSYSAGFEGEESYDETAYARKAAEHYGTNHFEISINKNDLTEALPEILGFVDEPVSDSTIIPIYFLSKLARQNGSVVILNGDGADELFAGYSKWLDYTKYLKYWKLIRYSPGFSRTAAGIISRNIFSGGKKQIINDIINRARLKTQFYIGDTGALKGTDLFYDIIPPGIYDIFDSNFNEFSGIRSGKNYTEWMSYWGLKSMVENIFLYRADRMGMANSIEIRVPYLDHSIVEFGMQMPQELKNANRTGKYILKKSLEKIVPSEFLYRKKMGFCVPVKEWAGREILSAVFPYFYDVNSELGLFEKKVIDEFKLLSENERTGTSGSLLLNLHIFTNWYKIWFE